MQHGLHALAFDSSAIPVSLSDDHERALPANAIDFCLADYDNVESVSIVLDTLFSRKGRYFAQGTDGFMSPLITKDHDDSENHAFPKFRDVAVACKVVERGFPGPAAKMSEAEWGRFFAQKKDELSKRRRELVWKIDLHSLAFTLLEVIPDVLLPATQRRFPKVLKLIEHLMFFREGKDMFDAKPRRL
jgi:hypothetical protein